jgi:hypothetical protein
MHIVRISSSLALLVTAALTVACSSAKDQAGAASSPAREINKSLMLNQSEGSAFVTLVSVIESYRPKDDIAKPRSGNFVALNLKFECKTGKYSANPLYVKLKKPDGKIIGSDDGEAVYAVPAGQSFSGSGGELSAGKTVAGMVVFDAAYDPAASILITNTMSHISGEWPVSGGEPRAGDGSVKQEINKSLTHKQPNGSALVTLVSVSESKGGLDKIGAPQSGTFVIVDLKYEGKTGQYAVNPLYVKLKKPDGKIIDQNEGNGSYGIPREESLGSGDLQPGKTVTGKIAFDAALQPGTKIVITDLSDKVTGEWPL